MLASVVDMVLDSRQQAKAAKDWATSDRIRDGLASVGIRVKDRKDGDLTGKPNSFGTDR